MIGEENTTAETQRAQRRNEDTNFLLRILSALSASGRFNSFFILAVIAGASGAIGQESAGVPFYYATGTIFTPQIATLVVGVNENVGQAVVSGDRKYVSLDVDTSLLGSPTIRRFVYQKPGLGFVGSPAEPRNAPASAGNGLTPTIAALPSEIAPTVSILDKPGMVLIAPLEK